MVILLFAFLGSAFYVVKHGVGREKFYFLYPIGLYVFYNMVFSALYMHVPTLHGVTGTVIGIVMTVALLALCGWIVARVRRNSMDRVLKGMASGIIPESVNKFEL